MTTPILNRQLPINNIAANPLGEQKVPVVPTNQQVVPVQSKTEPVNNPKLTGPVKDTVILNTKTAAQPTVINTAVDSTQKNIDPEQLSLPKPDEVKAQVKRPMNVGVVNPGVPSSYAEGKNTEPQIDPKMLAQAGINTNDPQQLAALGLSPEQMRELATNVQKNGKAGINSIIQAGGVALVAVTGLVMSFTTKGKAFAKNLWNKIQQSGFIGDVVNNVKSTCNDLKTKTSNLFSDVTKWNSPVTVCLEDKHPGIEHLSLTKYFSDLNDLIKKTPLSSSHFRPINIRFMNNQSMAKDEIENAIKHVWTIGEHFSGLDDITPRFKITMEGFGGGLENWANYCFHNSKNVDDFIEQIKHIPCTDGSTMSLLDHIQTVELSAAEPNSLMSGLFKNRNRIGVNLGQHMPVNERGGWLSAFANWFRL
ncbi:MAG: hypothetical protein WCK67_07535 [bacterium]